jgi:arylsulfatase
MRTERRVRRAYRDTVRSVDALVNALECDTPPDTAFIVHADHGEAFMEHGSYGHQRQLYEENLHVPLLGYNLPETGQVTLPATLSKLPKFIESIADESGTKTDGDRSLKMPTCPIAVAQTEIGGKVAVRTERWKYIDHGDESELFDLNRDPQEQRNCKLDFPDVAVELGTAVSNHRRKLQERQQIAAAAAELEEY